MKLYYLVALGKAVNSNGGIYDHGDVFCTFDAEITKGFDDLRGAINCANLDLVDQEEYERDYKTT